MKRFIALLGILLLALTACGPSQQGIQTTTGIQESVPSTVTKTNNDDYISMLEQVEEDTLAKNDKTQEVMVPVNNKRGVVGDSVAFGVNFNQVNKKAATYFMRVNFVEARDKNNNRIEVDKDTVKTWLRESQTLDFALGDKESQYMPVVIDIKNEIKPGTETVPGAYQYEISFFRRGKYNLDEELESLVKSVYVRVE